MELEYKEISSIGDKQVGEQVNFPQEWIDALGEPKKRSLTTEQIKFASWAHKNGHTFIQIKKALDIDLKADSIGKAVRQYEKN